MTSIYPSYNDITKPIKETYNTYKTTVVTSMITAVVVLISLAWNNVVQAIISYYYPQTTRETIKGKIIYACIITIFVIILQLHVFPCVIKYMLN